MGIMKLDFEAETQVSVEQQLDRIAFESNFTSNLIELFKTTLPSVVQKIHEAVSSSFIAKEPDAAVNFGRQLKGDYKSLSKKLETSNFINFKDMLVQVPEGFKGNFTEYLDFQDKVFNQVIANGNELLSEYSVILAAFITNKENKLSLKDHTGFYKKIQAQRVELAKGFDKFFNVNSDSPLQRLNQIIGRFEDVEDIVDKTVKLETNTKQSNLNEIQSSVKKISGYLDILIKQVQDDSVSNVSGSAARNIAEGAFEVAKFVEFISLFHFRTEQSVQTTKKLLDKLNEVL
jgi:hypothetical protein